MNSTPVQRETIGLSRLKLFFGLSRTPHALLDMATPGLAALLWLGAFPPPKVILLGLMTVFAGYTAVYALNDVIDYRVDRETLKQGSFRDSEHDLDAALGRHPIAQGLLSVREGLSWVVAWTILALVGAYALNPLCAIVFLTGCALEAMYCLLGRVSHLRVFVSGAVKTTGAIAAVFAVDPRPSFSFLAVLFLWLFFWEIGGQNIPNDWSDIENDRRLQATSVPIRFGPKRTKMIIFGSLILATAANVVLLLISPSKFQPPYLAACQLLGFYFLLLPAYRLYRGEEPSYALALFNRASYYPVAMLAVFVIKSMS